VDEEDTSGIHLPEDIDGIVDARRPELDGRKAASGIVELNRSQRR